MTIAFVSDARMRALNRTWRGLDRATDVLSFPATDAASARESREPSAERPHRQPRSPEPGARSLEPGARSPEPGARSLEPGARSLEPTHLGDIVIATGVAARQARAARHTEAVEWRVLALHGLLHLLGYDHERDDGEMARVEQRLRRKGGLASGLIERAPRRLARALHERHA